MLLYLRVTRIARICVMQRTRVGLYTTVRKSPCMKIENGFSKRNFPARKWSACTARRPYVFVLDRMLNINKNNQIRPLQSTTIKLSTVGCGAILCTHKSHIILHRYKRERAKKKYKFVHNLLVLKIVYRWF